VNVLTNLMDNIVSNWNLDPGDISSVIQPNFCSIVEYYNLTSYTDICNLNPNDNFKPAPNVPNASKGWLKTWMKILIFVLVGWLLAMWWIILFFSIKAKLGSSDEDEW
jgi:hypothetical protein